MQEILPDQIVVFVREWDCCHRL